MNRIWTIARREVRSTFDQPTGYVLLVVFLGINAFMFFRTAYLSNIASLRPMLDFLPWIFLFFVPAVAMRAMAEDNRGGMLEIVLAQPISEAELVLGKYLGVLLVLLLALATTLFIPIGLILGSPLPLGPVIAQYVGAALLAAAFGGIGVWASSLSRSQITAFILAVVVMFVLILVGLDPLLVGLPATAGAIAARLGVLSHFESLGRGVLDLRDVLYFLSVAAIFLVLAFASVMRRRLSRGGGAARRLRLGSLVLIGILVALNLAGGQIGGRLDLSPGHAYTLSPATRQIARSLDDLVTIKLYVSKELPTEFALTRRDVTDLLRDLRAAGKGKIRVVEEDPASDPAIADEAKTLGVVPVQFNVVGQSELQVKQGYFGLVLQHEDQHQTIPFVQQTEDLEYRLITAIRAMTRTTKPRIALVADPAAGTFRALEEELGKSFAIETPNLSDSMPLDSGLAAVAIASLQDSLPANELGKLGGYLDRGGKLLVMESGMTVSTQGPFATSRPLPIDQLLRRYGVAVAPNMVYDLRANEVVGVPTSFGQVLRSYPYFVRARSTRTSPINAELTDLALAWTSSLDTTGAKPGTVQPLFVTTADAGVASGNAMIDPNQDFPTTGLGTRLLAAAVTPKDSKARLVVVGNARVANDDMLQRSPQNLTFILNAIDWLAQDEALISIRAKDRRPPALVFSSAGLKQGVKYLNVVGLPLLIALYGVVHLLRRRRLASLPYRPAKAVAA